MGFSKTVDKTTRETGTQDVTRQTQPGLGLGGPIRNLARDLYGFTRGAGDLPTPQLGISDPTRAAAGAATGLVGGSPLQSAAEEAAIRATQFQDPVARFAGLRNLGFGTQGLRGLEQAVQAARDPFSDPLLRRQFERGSELLGEQFRRQSTGALSGILQRGGSLRGGLNAPQRRVQELLGRELVGGQQDLLSDLISGVQNRGFQAATQLGALGGRAPEQLLGLSTGEQRARLAGAGLFPGFQGANIGGIQAALGAGRDLTDIQKFNELARLDAAMQPFNLTGKALGQIGNIGSLFGPQRTVGQTTGTRTTPVEQMTPLGMLFNAGTGLLGAYLESDRRLKTRISYVGEENGIPLYTFAYKSNPKVLFKGVMAQDLLDTEHADAVHLNPIDGMFYVDYRRLGIEMEAVHGQWIL